MRHLNRLAPFPCIEGIVEHGFGRGSKTLGYPTANLNSASSASVSSFLSSIECRDGVYIGWVTIPNFSLAFKAAISVGINPTFEDSKVRLLEAHLLDYTGPDFYDMNVRIVLCAHIRDSLKFTSIQGLIDEIHHDCEFARSWLENDMHFSRTRDHAWLRVHS